MPFDDAKAARAWVEGFVAWYNTTHRHSAIRFVTPDERHAGDEATILQRRHRLYERARANNPARWARSTRDWTPIETVYLNPDDTKSKRSDASALGRVVERGGYGSALAVSSRVQATSNVTRECAVA